MEKNEPNQSSLRDFLARVAKTGALVAPVIATFSMMNLESRAHAGAAITNPGGGSPTDPGNGNVADPGNGNVADPGNGNVADPGNGGGVPSPTDPNAGNGRTGDFNYRLPNLLPSTR
jgi:hypothetical protein